LTRCSPPPSLLHWRDLGQDVIAVAERGELRAMSDDDVFAWAISQRHWLLNPAGR
jgi:hypothetical protein